MKKILFYSLLGTSLSSGFVISFDDSDFGTSAAFSNVTNFDFEAQISGAIRTGQFLDPELDAIGYNVSGTLDVTPSGFPGFSFQLSHLIAPPPAPPSLIPGSLFYRLNSLAPVGDRFAFTILESADLSDGLQVSELAGSGNDVVFRFNGCEVDTGRYHPTFIELRADGTGIIQNANNTGGDNPQDGFVGDIDVDFGEEFITNLTFDPSTLTIAIPEPSSALLLGVGSFFLLQRRRTLR